MLSAACPACGAPVLFRGATSIVAVCPHCRSTLVRSGTRVEDVGRASTVLEDHSPLQLHAAGAWRGAAFTVVGRIQLRHERGVWSEWHLAFANGRSGWLADDMGELVLEFLQPPAPLPELAQLVPGRRVTLAGADFEVVERSRSTVAAVEG